MQRGGDAMTQTPHLFVVKEQEVKNVADPSRNHGVYALSWRFANEPPLTRHWAYYLTSEEMEAALWEAIGRLAPLAPVFVSVTVYMRPPSRGRAS